MPVAVRELAVNRQFQGASYGFLSIVIHKHFE
jgi:hypothetical protein